MYGPQDGLPLCPKDPNTLENIIGRLIDNLDAWWNDMVVTVMKTPLPTEITMFIDDHPRIIQFAIAVALVVIVRSLFK